LFGAGAGCTVVSDGLAEYEVLDDGRVAITLIRAVGELSRDDLPERPGHAGWPAATPMAQCHGPFAANFALAWHGADTAEQRARIVEIVDDVLLPITGVTQRDALRVPAPLHGFALEGEGLALSTIKESDDGRYIVLRCLNVTDAAVHGAWRVPRAQVSAWQGRLDETPRERLPSEGGYVPIAVAACGIHTTLIALSDAEPAR
jgi:mannosylglycerate hydrolase